MLLCAWLPVGPVLGNIYTVLTEVGFESCQQTAQRISSTLVSINYEIQWSTQILRSYTEKQLNVWLENHLDIWPHHGYFNRLGQCNMICCKFCIEQLQKIFTLHNGRGIKLKAFFKFWIWSSGPTADAVNVQIWDLWLFLIYSHHPARRS